MFLLQASIVHNLIQAYKLHTNLKIVRSSSASYNDLKEFHSELYLDHIKKFTSVDEEYMTSEDDEQYGIGIRIYMTKIKITHIVGNIV